MNRRNFLKLVATGIPATICAVKLGIAKPRATVPVPTSLLPGHWRVQIERSGVLYDCEPMGRTYGVAYLCPLCHSNVVEFRDGTIVGATHKRRCGQMVLTSLFDVSTFRGHADPRRIDEVFLSQMSRDMEDAWNGVQLKVTSAGIYRL